MNKVVMGQTPCAVLQKIQGNTFKDVNIYEKKLRPMKSANKVSVSQ